jgi:hypothetical protein
VRRPETAGHRYRNRIVITALASPAADAPRAASRARLASVAAG